MKWLCYRKNKCFKKNKKKWQRKENSWKKSFNLKKKWRCRNRLKNRNKLTNACKWRTNTWRTCCLNTNNQCSRENNSRNKWNIKKKLNKWKNKCFSKTRNSGFIRSFKGISNKKRKWKKLWQKNLTRAR